MVALDPGTHEPKLMNAGGQPRSGAVAKVEGLLDSSGADQHVVQQGADATRVERASVGGICPPSPTIGRESRWEVRKGRLRGGGGTLREKAYAANPPRLH